MHCAPGWQGLGTQEGRGCIPPIPEEREGLWLTMFCLIYKYHLITFGKWIRRLDYGGSVVYQLLMMAWNKFSSSFSSILFLCSGSSASHESLNLKSLGTLFKDLEKLLSLSSVQLTTGLTLHHSVLQEYYLLYLKHTINHMLTFFNGVFGLTLSIWITMSYVEPQDCEQLCCPCCFTCCFRSSLISSRTRFVILIWLIISPSEKKTKKQ